MDNPLLYYLWRLPRRLIIILIKLYQKTLSFDHGPLRRWRPYGFCRFSPSCSQYAVEALGKYGVIKGGLMTSWRILRCNPWNRGGYDPVR